MALTDPIQAAFSSAIHDFRLKLKNEKIYRDILQTTSIEQVYDATDKLQEEQARTGHLRHLSKIEPFLEGLRGYASVIEVFMQAKPDVLALIWGPIKLLLQWANVLKQSLDAIIDTTAEIGILLPEFRKVAQLFENSSLIKEVLVLFFRDMLDFYLIALKFFSQPRLKIFFESLWPKHRDKIKVVVSHIQRHTLLLRNEVRLEHIQAEYDFRQQALEHFEKAEATYRQQEYQSIRMRMAPQTYEDKLEYLDARTCNGTGEWLSHHSTFQSWLDTNSSTQFLWLEGIPGSGKTYLARTAVHHSRRKGRTLFAFLSYKNATRTSALSILHSLIFQLAADDIDMQAIVCQSSGESFRSNLEASKTIFTTLLLSTGPAYIIVDGLDEIDAVDRCRILKLFKEILPGIKETRILISSRAEEDISKILKDICQSIRVDEHNMGSIQAYITRHTLAWYQEREFFPEAREDMDKLLAPLAAKSKGMFLYAKVVLMSIKDLDLEEIRKDLAVLPETLNDAYARILDRINQYNSPALKNKARMIIGWIGVSPIPMTIHELEQALIVTSQRPSGTWKVASRLPIVSICGPIVEVVDDYVQFVHFTVKEFFLSTRISNAIDPGESRLSLASRCIEYLCQPHHDTEITPDQMSDYLLYGAYRLHEYARTMWCKLVQDCALLDASIALPDRLINVLEQLLRDRGKDSSDDSLKMDNLVRLQSMKKRHPKLYNLLARADTFRSTSFTSEFRIDDCQLWVNRDPLNVSQITVSTHKKLNTLLYNSSEGANSVRQNLEWHYGKRLYKCDVLGCTSRRHGFQSRTLLQSHITLHSRPWTCNVAGCEFEEGGFLSRKMRDDHFEKYHVDSQSAPGKTAESLNRDERKLILLNLVKSNDVAEVRSFLEANSVKEGELQADWELLDAAAQYAQLPMIRLLASTMHLRRCLFFTSSIQAALAGKNVETFRLLLQTAIDYPDDEHGIARIQASAVECAFPNILKHGIDAMHELLEQWCEKRFAKQPRPTPYLTHPSTISATRGDIYLEQLLLRLWKVVPPDFWQSRYWRDSLSNVASTTCSIDLAKGLMEKGISVDCRSGPTRYTALCYAARKTSEAAAGFMRFLLSNGAEPEIEIKDSRPAPTGRSKEKPSSRLHNIGDEEGARNISKWLGVSWEELVEQTKEKREIRRLNESAKRDRVEKLGKWKKQKKQKKEK